MSRQTISKMFNSCKPVKIVLYFTTEIGQKKHAMSYKIYNKNSVNRIQNLQMEKPPIVSYYSFF